MNDYPVTMDVNSTYGPKAGQSRSSYFSPPECDHGGRVLWLPAMNPKGLTLQRAAEWHNRTGRSPHLIWDPDTGASIEMIEPGFKNALFAPRDPRSDLYSVEVVPSASLFFFEDSEHFPALLERLEPLGVPGVFPLGPPPGPEFLFIGEPAVDKPGHYAVEQVSHLLQPFGSIDTNRFRRRVS